MNADDPLSFLIKLNAMDHPPLVNSIPYGYIERELAIADPFYINTFDHEAMKLGLRGVTLVTSSGNDGVGNFVVREDILSCGYRPSFPASSRYVTTIGGTQGVEKNAKASETAADCTVYIAKDMLGMFAGGIVSGGGFSEISEASSHQRSHINKYFTELKVNHVPVPGYSRTGRGYPDLSFAAMQYLMVNGGEYSFVSGTAASAPIFAGMVSLVNAERNRIGKSPLGYMNPSIYSFAHKFTRDIVNGSNHCSAVDDCSKCCHQGFHADIGWVRFEISYVHQNMYFINFYIRSIKTQYQLIFAIFRILFLGLVVLILNYFAKLM
jgi:tripeptidyl-peptidase-1